MDNWTLDSRMVPLDLHIALDYVPWDGDYGWDIETIIDELNDALARKFAGAGPVDIRVVLVEVV